MTIQTPCIRQCCLNADDICIGCHRSLQDILDWHTVDEVNKLRILERAENRKQHQPILEFDANKLKHLKTL
ncbi:hypothetical protein MSP8887_01466 [Marinomonas spartinae]|uniref:Fe-S protein n=1 Tax=Marinomonas spartinae TaxID=1792290 RepID=A0A1A8TS20_9GAMM|nr:DUF1289 domain-containing protein [Marinomonas spartinae]SBS31190.1 hypothetical protein MSP8887_01466 [Marinomonas spartinae]SBS36075.1 hypothetical protein MSP8886_03568 [Marinomonas spartinae]